MDSNLYRDSADAIEEMWCLRDHGVGFPVCNMLRETRPPAGVPLGREIQRDERLAKMWERELRNQRIARRFRVVASTAAFLAVMAAIVWLIVSR